jgi:propionyl-CoA synthetase
MPMIPQTAFAMLACARIGWFIRCFGGFAPHELAIRIDDCKPEQYYRFFRIEIDRLIAYKPLVDSIELARTKKVIVLIEN